MAVTSGTNYTHIDLKVQGSEDVVRHLLEDSQGRDMTAPTETGDTASGDYAAGDYFILGGVLYRATEDIAAGGQLVPDTNCESVTVGTALSELGGEAAALDGEVAQLQGDLTVLRTITEKNNGITEIEFEPGYIDCKGRNLVTDIENRVTTGEVGSIMCSAVYPCQPGDKFTVTLYGAGNDQGRGRAWDWLDSGCHSLAWAQKDATCTDEELTAPEDAAYLVLNTKMDEGHEDYYAITGAFIVDRVTAAESDIDELQGGVEAATENIGTLQEAVEDLDERADVTDEAMAGLQEDIDTLSRSIYTENTESGTQVIVPGSAGPVATVRADSAVTVEHSGKNLLVFPYYTKQGATIKGVTYSIDPVNGAVTARGTATADAKFVLYPEDGSLTQYRMPIKAGNYKLSGCPAQPPDPAGGLDYAYQILLAGFGGGNKVDRGSGVTLAVPEDSSVYISIIVKSGNTVDATFYPMIEAGTEVTGFAPYRHETLNAGPDGVSSRIFPNDLNLYEGASSFDVTYYTAAARGGTSFNAADFGVTGDGVTDDSDAIQAALDAAEGYDLYFPAGTYLFSKTLNIKSGTHVHGAGEATLFQLADSFSLTAYPWREGDPDVNHHYRYSYMYIGEDEQGVILDNFKLQGPVGEGAAFFDENLDGITIRGRNHIVRNLVVTKVNYFPSDFSGRENNGCGHCIKVQDGANVLIENCDASFGGYENIGTENANCVTISCCKVGYACQTGLQIHRNCENILVTGCNIDCHDANYKSGVTIHNGWNECVDPQDETYHQPYKMRNIVIQNCFITSALHFASGHFENSIRIVNNWMVGIQVNDYTRSDTELARIKRENWVIMGNWFNSQVYIKCSSFVLANNIFRGNAENPVNVRTVAGKYQILGNVFVGAHDEIVFDEGGPENG